MTNSRIPPCFQCDSRHEGCHGKCTEYATWKQARDAVLENVHREKQGKDDVAALLGKFCNRLRKQGVRVKGKSR